MLDIFGAIGQIGRMLPGYIEGREKAIQSNWNDLNQYNKVQAGQLANMWTEDTYNMRWNQELYNTANQEMQMLSNLMGFNINKASYPGRYQAAGIQGQLAPHLALAMGLGYLTNGWGTMGGMPFMGGGEMPGVNMQQQPITATSNPSVVRR